jgi:hypothetical protein
MLNFNNILKKIVEKDPTLEQEYWAIPYDESLVDDLDNVVPGVFIATLNDGKKYFLIPYSVDLFREYNSLYTLVLDQLGYLYYIDSKSGVSDLLN